MTSVKFDKSDERRGTNSAAATTKHLVLYLKVAMAVAMAMVLLLSLLLLLLRPFPFEMSASFLFFFFFFRSFYSFFFVSSSFFSRVVCVTLSSSLFQIMKFYIISDSMQRFSRARTLRRFNVDEFS